jgi:hypothetical protein
MVTYPHICPLFTGCCAVKSQRKRQRRAIRAAANPAWHTHVNKLAAQGNMAWENKLVAEGMKLVKLIVWKPSFFANLLASPA